MQEVTGNMTHRTRSRKGTEGDLAVDPDQQDADLTYIQDNIEDRAVRFAVRGVVLAYQLNREGFLLAAEDETPDVFARQLAQLLPRRSGRSEWDDLIGPFHNHKGALTRIDGVTTRQGLDRRREAHQVLGCQTQDGAWLYPTFQFAGGDVIDGLSAVLADLVPASDGWTAALWLRTPNTRLAGERPIDRLNKRDDVGSVIASARVQAAEWRGDRIELKSQT